MIDVVNMCLDELYELADTRAEKRQEVDRECGWMCGKGHAANNGDLR